MSFETISEQRSFGGVQGVYQHHSERCDCPMRFAVFRPPQAEAGPVPVLWYLSGLTCTEQNFITKAGAQRAAAEAGIALVAPDTSPPRLDIPGEDAAYDFGVGAGFYVDATEAPWSAHYQMFSWVTEELPALLGTRFGDRLNLKRQSIMGHSMGGHGALICALRLPERYRSVSALAPICAPTEVSWGEKTLGGYLGRENRDAWKRYDATALIEAGARPPGGAILVDQGAEDEFLPEQLRPDRLEEACQTAGVALELRQQAGYDHSYYFVASFIPDHVAWHAERLLALAE